MAKDKKNTTSTFYINAQHAMALYVCVYLSKPYVVFTAREQRNMPLAPKLYEHTKFLNLLQNIQ